MTGAQWRHEHLSWNKVRSPNVFHGGQARLDKEGREVLPRHLNRTSVAVRDGGRRTGRNGGRRHPGGRTGKHRLRRPFIQGWHRSIRRGRVDDSLRSGHAHRRDGGSLHLTCKIPANVLVLANPDAQDPTEKTLTMSGAGAVVLSVSNVELEMPFIVTDGPAGLLSRLD